MARSLSGCVVVLTRWCLRHLFALQVKGLEHLPQHGPFIIAPNHISLLDPPVVAAALPPQVLARTYWGGWTGIMFANRLMRLFSRGARVVPIDPQRGPLSNLAFGITALRQGYNLVWFPECAISRTGVLQQFRPGIGLILTVHPVPVVPVWIAGTYEAMPRGQRRLRRHPITITFGAPVGPETLRSRGERGEPYERVTAALHDGVAELGGCLEIIVKRCAAMPYRQIHSEGGRHDARPRETYQVRYHGVSCRFCMTIIHGYEVMSET